MKRAEVIVLEDMCKECGYCIEACLKGLLELSEKYNKKSYHPVIFKDNGECTGCAACYINCPEVALEVRIYEEKDANEG